MELQLAFIGDLGRLLEPLSLCIEGDEGFVCTAEVNVDDDEDDVEEDEPVSDFFRVKSL